MKKIIVALLMVLTTSVVFAGNVLNDSFEYANQDGHSPMGWVCPNNTWLCGYLEKDHNRIAHTGDWYAYTDGSESWMFMSMYMSEQLKYRLSLWAISDGGYQLEIWAGNEASGNAMTELLLNEIVSSGTYEQFSVSIEELSANHEYIGIHAVQSYCGDCILTIDDVKVDIVERYEIVTNPYDYYTITAPGEQAEFSFTFSNFGYEPSGISISVLSEYFSNVRLYLNGTQCTTFNIGSNETVEFTGVATLNPGIPLGTMAFADILFTLACDCGTTLFTLWATVGYDSVEETDITEMSVYPNPSNGNITIEGKGVLTISNVLGQEILKKQITDKEIVNLESGLYFVKINEVTKKVIIR